MRVELTLIKLRCKQLFRALKTVNIIKLLIFILLLSIFALAISEKIQKSHSPYLLSLYPLVVILTHVQRKDYLFLKKINIFTLRLYLLEYTLLCIPLSVMFCLGGYPGLAITGHFITILTSIVSLKLNLTASPKPKNWSIPLVPDALFEWKATIRLYNYKFFVLWGLGAFATIHEYAYFFFLLLLAPMISTTFNPSEGKELRPINTVQLLLKLKHNTCFLMAFITPHICFFLLCNPLYWYIILGITIYSILYQTYCILHKYGNYSQYRNASNGVHAFIFMLICPVLFFSIPLTIYSFIKAKNNLKHA